MVSPGLYEPGALEASEMVGELAVRIRDGRLDDAHTELLVPEQQ